jgi:hypothetical protein
MSHLTTTESKEQARAADSFSFHKLKCFLENSFPESCEALRERWYEHVSHQMGKSIAAQYGLAVQSGPFQGMQYLADLLDSKKVIQYGILPKILGCFEAELHGVLMQVVRRNYGRVVNIGCSEGYYSVGLSLRLPDARVFAFDIDPHARQLCERMARLNGVQDRMVVDGECRAEHLQALGGSRTLVICDCEGCELGLLRTDLAPRLSMCDFIVELHDCVDPTISKVVPSRFANTHDVTILTEIVRDPAVYPSLKGFSPYKQRLAVGEYRWGAPGVWTFMTTRYNQQV